MHLIARAVGATLIATCGTALSADEFFFRVEAERLACIAEHRDFYVREAKDDILYIDPEECPPKNAPTLRYAMRNEAPDVNFSADGALDVLLIVLPEHLECLGRFDLRGTTGVLRFYPDECNVVVDPD